jgi:hypothetical protein
MAEGHSAIAAAQGVQKGWHDRAKFEEAIAGQEYQKRLDAVGEFRRLLRMPFHAASS